MTVDPMLDEQAIIARIRERLRESLSPAPLPPASPRPAIVLNPSGDEIEQELATLEGVSDICDVPVRSYRRVVGRAIVFARTFARRLLAPSLERQVSYNATNQRLLRALWQQIRDDREQTEALRRRCERLEKQVEELRASIGGA